MEDKITVQIGEEERELFMSYALLNRLARYIGNEHADVTSIFINPEAQHQVLVEILAPRKNGKIAQGFDLENIELTREVADEIIEWAGAHVMDFFLRGLEKTAALGQANQKRALSLTSSLSGMQALASNTLSAGFTDASPANSDQSSGEIPTET